MRRFLPIAFLMACPHETLGPDPEAKIDGRDESDLSGAGIPIHGTAPVAEGSPEFRFFAYQQVIDRVAGMANDDNLFNRVQARGLNVLDVTWEDTGRSE